MKTLLAVAALVLSGGCAVWESEPVQKNAAGIFNFFRELCTAAAGASGGTDNAADGEGR